MTLDELVIALDQLDAVPEEVWTSAIESMRLDVLSNEVIVLLENEKRVVIRAPRFAIG